MCVLLCVALQYVCCVAVCGYVYGAVTDMFTLLCIACSMCVALQYVATCMVL